MKYILFFTGILFSVISFSQNRQGAGGDMPAEGIITGYVIEKESSKPFEYANIVIYSKRDSSIVSGGITDKNGYFRIDKVRYGKFFVEVNFIGYAKHIIPEVAIKPDKKEIDLGKISLSINAEMLNEVSIEANVNQVDYRLDRKVVNVNQDIISAGATAVEVLENVPSVTTDIDGNVALRGSESFLVMVDGRPSPMQGSEALQQIPASSIESIEIITNPSAKYDPDGVGGIINVVLKKDKRAGYNGQISANVGSFYTHGGDALFNFRTQKINFFIGGEYGDRRHKGEGESHRQSFIDDTSTYILNNFSQNYRNRKSGSFRTGLDYYINDNEIITISGRYGLSGHGMGNSAWTGSWYDYDGITQDFYYYISNTDMESNSSYFSGEINYMKKFKKAGHEIQVFGSYAGDFDNEENYFNETLSDHMRNPIGDIISEHRTVESGNGNTITAKADYVLPLFEKGKFETGYQLKISTLNNDYRYQTFVSDEWSDDPNQINPYTYTNNIQSGYAIFANYWKKLGYQIGMRTEYTDRLFHQTTTDQKWAYNKFDFFPSVHISYQLPAEMQLLASYSRRLDRPRGWYLDPFVEIVDPNNIRQGNPNLLPEYTNSYDLSFQKKFDQHFVSVEAYMRQTYNKISWITVVNPENPNIFIMTFDNIGEDLSAGGEVMANLNLTKWYNLNISGSGFYYEIISENYNSGSSFSWTARLNNTFRLKKTGTSIQIGANYNGPQISAQGTRSASWAASGGIRQDFLDRKLSLSLNFRNIFRTMKMESISETDSFYQYSLRHPRGPIVTFSVTYKINDFKNRKDKGLDNDYDGGDEGGM
jgi:outer membrane receptor protein involved in Fe transport